MSLTVEEVRVLKAAVNTAARGTLTAQELGTVRLAQEIVWRLECELNPGLAHVPDHPRKVRALEELIHEQRQEAGVLAANRYTSVERTD